MISVGSRDGRKGLSLRYGVEGENMDLETELEEGEACFQNHNHNDDEDSTIDPDVALSYIDEKLQDVLGHFQKDFEGGVSAENLGAKFGGYGSFLPSYQRSPLCPHPKTPPKILTYNASASPVNPHAEGAHQNPASQSSAPQAARHGSAPVSVSAPRGPSVNGKTKQEVPPSSARRGNKCASNGPPRANASDQNSLKVRIKVGPDNMSSQRNAEIYSGLGLDVSPTSSLEASPANSDGFLHVPQEAPEESPTSILEIMMSFPVSGGTLLSPLPEDLLCLTEKESWEDGRVQKGSQESTVTIANGSDSGKVDRNVSGEKNSKSTEKISVSMESTNGNDLKLPLPSNTHCNSVDFEKGVMALSQEPKEESFDVAKEEPVGQVERRVEKISRKDGAVGMIWDAKSADFDEKNSMLQTKADSDLSKGSKTLDTGLVKPLNQKGAQKATSREKDLKPAPFKETSSGGKKKPKASQGFENDVREVLNGGEKLDFSSTTKSKNSKSYVEDLKKNNGKVKDTYKDFFGELDLEPEDDDLAMDEKPSGEKLKESLFTEKGTLDSNVSSKELNGKKSQKPSSSVFARVSGSHVLPTTGNVPVSDIAAAAVAAPLVNEDWVCCDKCEKWRLLPPGVNPGSLPEKWLCSMLDWLPGMNRCSISEEETTKAITSRFPGPAPIVQGSQPLHPGEPQPGLIPVGAPLPDHRHQHFGSQAPYSVLKKKHTSKDLPNETKERPSLSSNSSKKTLQTSHKSRSLNGVNQSPRVNEVEFQDSGQSSSLIAEKHRLKHKEKKRLSENFVDEGDNAHQKIRNKRGTIQDYSRESKKIRTEDKHGTDEDLGSDHGGAAFKASRSSSTSVSAGISRKDRPKHTSHPKYPKSTSKVSARNPETQHQKTSNDGTLPMGKFDQMDVSKKRRSNEFECVHTYDEESSETNRRKEKKAREEETGLNKGIIGGRNVKDEQVKSLDLIDSSKRDAASLAATSSSSKVSGSHRTKPNNQEPKGSPVESVSSSPLRVSNAYKFTSSRTNIGGVEDCQDAGSPKKDDAQIPSRRGSQERDLGHLSGNKGKAELVPSLDCDIVGGLGVETTSQSYNEERMNGDHCSRPRKKGSSMRSKDKSRSIKPNADKAILNASEPTNENIGIPSKGVRNKSQEKPSVSSDKFGKGSVSKKDFLKPLSENAKRDGLDVRIGAKDVKQNVPVEVEDERASKRDVDRGKSHSLPPLGRGQNETERLPRPIPGSQKAGNSLARDAGEGSDALKAPDKSRKAENQNGNQPLSMKHPTPNRHKGRDHDAPSPLRRDTSSQGATNVLKEAKDLKHLADRRKNSGSHLESRALYFQAALKFLQGASLLEACNEGGKHGDVIQAMSMYSSTAKLCEYCAHEYEKSKEMATAALAYKCTEVAYLKVVYSSHTSACKDRHELQTSLQIGPTGESPSSSASDLDNLNNSALVDKAALAKGVNSPQVAVNHVIAARNKPNFVRILNYAQDVNFAMEASRKSRIAFAAASSKLEETHCQEGISAVKTALDFNFQDVEGLLRLVRVAMEVINK